MKIQNRFKLKDEITYKFVFVFIYFLFVPFTPVEFIHNCCFNNYGMLRSDISKPTQNQ